MTYILSHSFLQLTADQGERGRAVMLRQMLLNSTAAARGFDMMTHTHAPPTLNVSQGPVSVAALLKPTGRGGGLREGELSKPDLVTYVVMCLLLFLLVLLIVFFINCQLRTSFFASMPYDRSLREARSSYKWTGPYMFDQSTPIWDQFPKMGGLDSAP